MPTSFGSARHDNDGIISEAREEPSKLVVKRASGSF